MPNVNSDHEHAIIADLDTLRSATKAEKRTKTARQIAAGQISPQQAQEQNAPISEPVKIVDLWSAIRRHTAKRAKKRQ